MFFAQSYFTTQSFILTTSSALVNVRGCLRWLSGTLGLRVGVAPTVGIGVYVGVGVSVGVAVGVGKGVFVGVGTTVGVFCAAEGTAVGNGVADGVGAHAASMTNTIEMARACFMFAFSFERT
jgi:hypothetical protein